MHRMRKLLPLLAATATLLPGADLPSDELFAATYSKDEVREEGSSVALKLTVELVNRSGAEVHYGRLFISVTDATAKSVAPIQSLDFDRIFMQLEGSTRLSGSLILARESYQSQLSSPSLRASFNWFDENAVPRASELELTETAASARP